LRLRVGWRVDLRWHEVAIRHSMINLLRPVDAPANQPQQTITTAGRKKCVQHQIGADKAQVVDRAHRGLAANTVLVGLTKA
jgi:hypothetical protein